MRRPRGARRRTGAGSRKFLAVATLAFLAASPVPGARAVTRDGQVWLQGILRLRLPGRLRLWVEAQPRIGGDGLRQLLLRPAIGFAVTPRWTLYQGWGYTPSFDPYRRENRFYQESLFDHFVGDLRFIHRARLEERFIEAVDGVSLRARYMLRLTHPVDAGKRWFLAVSDEAFATLNDAAGGPRSGFDQNLAYAGIRWQATPTTAFELGYLHQFVNRSSDDDASNDNAYVGIDVSL